MNRFTKRVLILAVFVLCLFGLTILGAAAASTDGYADDAAAIEAGKVARVGGTATSNEGATYYATLNDAISNVSAEKNVVWLITDWTQTAILPKGNATPASYTLTSIDPETVTLYSNTGYLFDLGAGSTIVPTLTNITIVGQGSLGYFNNVTININTGVTFTSPGHATYGLMHVQGNAKVNITDATLMATGTYPIINCGGPAIVTMTDVTINAGNAGFYGGNTAITLTANNTELPARTYADGSNHTIPVGTYTTDAAAIAVGATVRIGAEGATAKYFSGLPAAVAAAADGDTIYVLVSHTGYGAAMNTNYRNITIEGVKSGDVYPTITEANDAFKFVHDKATATPVTGSFTLKNVNINTNGALFQMDYGLAFTLINTHVRYNAAKTAYIATMYSNSTFTMDKNSSIIVDAVTMNDFDVFYANTSWTGTITVAGKIEVNVKSTSGWASVIQSQAATNTKNAQFILQDGANIKMTSTGNAVLFRYDGQLIAEATKLGDIVLTCQNSARRSPNANNATTFVNVVFNLASGSPLQDNAPAALTLKNCAFLSHDKAVAGRCVARVGNATVVVDGVTYYAGYYDDLADATAVAAVELGAGDTFHYLYASVADAVAAAVAGNDDVIHDGDSTTATVLYLDGKTITVYSDDAAGVAAAATAAGAPIKLVDAENNTCYVADLATAIAKASEGAKIYNIGADDSSTATPVNLNGCAFTLYSTTTVNLEDVVDYVAEYNGVLYTDLEPADAAAKADGKKYRVGNNMPTYYNNVADALAAAADGESIYSVDGTGLQTSFTVDLGEGASKTVNCYYASSNQGEINAIHAQTGKVAVVNGTYYDTAEAAFAAANGSPVVLLASLDDEAAVAAGYALRINAGDGATYFKTIIEACTAAANEDTIYVVGDFTSTTEGSTGGKTLSIIGVQKGDGSWPVITNTASNVFNVQSGADLTVKNLVINSTTTANVVYVTGKVTFENVEFNINKTGSARAFDTAAGSEIVFGEGTKITVETCGSNLVNVNGKCTVKEGASILIKAISNNPFRVSHANAVLTIEGGDIKHVGTSNGLVYAPTGKLDVTGGSIVQTGAMPIVQAESCAITISGGTITHTGATKAIIQASGGTVTVSGTAKLYRSGATTASSGYVFDMSGASALVIAGGEIYLNDTTSKASFVASFTGTASFEMSGGTVTATGCTNNVFLWSGTAHTATFTGGTLNCGSTANEALKLNAATAVSFTNTVINGLGMSIFYIPTSAECSITLGAGTQVNLKSGNFTLSSSGVVNFTIDGASVNVSESGGTFINGGSNWNVLVKDINFYSTVASAVIKASGGSVEILDGSFKFGVTPTYAAGAYIVSMDGASGTVDIRGGEFYCGSGANAAVYGAGTGVVVNIYNGYFENNGESVLLVNGGATLNVYAATVVLQPSHKALGSNNAYAVIRCSRDNGVSYVNLMGGIYINNNDADATSAANGCSNSVIFKNSTKSTVSITGGIFLVTGRQDYFFRTAGNANGATSNPPTDIPVIKNDMVKMKWGGREYYCMSFNIGAPVAPVVGSNVQIRLVENSTGLLFTSVLEADLYEAMLTWFGNAPAGSVLKFGTVIATLNKVTTVGQFTMEALDEAGFVYLNIEATETGAKLDADGNLVINAAMVNLREGYYDTVFTAVPYAMIVTPDTTDEDPIYYGAYNTNSTAASMSYLAQLALADNEATRGGEYDYKSVTVQNAYNRYTRDQQAILQGYLAHEHNYDYKGYCADCETGAATELALGNTVKVYAEYETVNYYQLTLAANVSYRISFAKTLGVYKIYDAEGNLCTVSDNIFTSKTAGTYYLVFFATRVGTTDLYVEHIHNADYKGYCSVCEDPDLLVELTLDSAYNLLLVKGNNYYYHIEMTAGVQYMVLTMNAEYVIYNAEGRKCTVKESIFSCTETGDYYIVATATISAKGSAKVEHIHNYDFKGDCSVEGCDATMAQTIPGIFYENAVKPACVKDSVLYYGVELAAGKTYTVNVKGIIATYTLYNAAGQRVTLDNKNSFACETSGSYYLVINVQSTATAEIYMTYVHDCEYDHMGVCGVCGENVATEIEVGKTETADLRADKTYYFTFTGDLPAAVYTLSLPEGVTNFTLYYADGTVVTVTDGSFTLAQAYDQDLSLMIVMGEQRTYGDIKLQHVHEYGYDGYCEIEGCSVSIRAALTADNPKAITYETVGEKHYYRINLNEGDSYTVNFADANATWELFDEAGTSVATSGEYACTADGYYYLVVTVTEPSTSIDATITVATVVPEPAPVPGE